MTFLCLEAVTEQIPSGEAPALQEKTNLYQTSYVHSPLQGGGNIVKPINTLPNPRSSMLYYVTTCSFLVLPENGIMSLYLFQEKSVCRSLKQTHFFLHQVSPAFAASDMEIMSLLSIHTPACLTLSVSLSVYLFVFPVGLLEQVTHTFHM